MVSGIVNGIFGCCSVTTILTEEALLCRQCQQSLDRLVGLRAEVHEKEDEIRRNVKQAELDRGLEPQDNECYD